MIAAAAVFSGYVGTQAGLPDPSIQNGEAGSAPPTRVLPESDGEVAPTTEAVESEANDEPVVEEPSSGSETVEQDQTAVLEAFVERILANVRAMQSALGENDWDGARRFAAGARDEIVAANAYLRGKRDSFEADEFRVGELRLEAMRMVMDATVAGIGWAQSASALTTAPRTASEDEALAILYSLEAVLPSGERVARAYDDVADRIAHVLATEPEAAMALEWDEDDVELFRGIANKMRNVQASVEEALAQVRERLANRYTPQDERLLPLASSRPPIPAGIVSDGLASLFGSFDGNGDGRLSVREAKEFFYWVEDNIPYRYDDEDATETFPGFPVGDGREGPDYWQTPTETFEERFGDCEDLNALEVAFYNYWGVTAYQAYVNANDPAQVDHAIAIVLVGQAEEDFRALLGDHPHYTYDDDNEFGIPAGVYAIIDNAYSDDFGFISTGVAPGQFVVQAVATLGEHFGLEVE